MATALARIFEDDHGLSTLIICPKNLVKMWQDYVDQLPPARQGAVHERRAAGTAQLSRRYRLVLIDESHNLRNREGKRYRAIQEYIEQNESKCILLSATPYNKTYLDLSAQLRLFVPEDQDSASAPRSCCARSARPSSSAGTSAPCARWPPSRRASTPTTGAT